MKSFGSGSSPKSSQYAHSHSQITRSKQASAKLLFSLASREARLFVVRSFTQNMFRKRNRKEPYIILIRTSKRACARRSRARTNVDLTTSNCTPLPPTPHGKTDETRLQDARKCVYTHKTHDAFALERAHHSDRLITDNLGADRDRVVHSIMCPPLDMYSHVDSTHARAADRRLPTKKRHRVHNIYYYTNEMCDFRSIALTIQSMHSFWSNRSDIQCRKMRSKSGQSLHA